MELYLVKEEVKIIKVNEAFCKTNQFNSFINGIELNASEQGFKFSELFSDKEDRTLLTVSNLPVTFRSICSDVNEHSERFAKRVEKMLRKNYTSENFGSIQLELIIPKDPNSVDGYFVLSSDPAEGSRVNDNVFKRLDHQLDYMDLDLSVEVSFCHLPTANSPVSQESLVILKKDYYEFCTFEYEDQIGSCKPPETVRIPLELMEGQWWEQGTGLIYSKSSVKLTLREDAVNRIYGCLNVNLDLLDDKVFTDLEIGCKSGEIVKCHRAFLADKSKVLREKFEEMWKWGKAGPWKLKMEISEQAVEAFLEYIYCGRVSGGLCSCELALELLKAGHAYRIKELEDAMVEIIMAKDSSDLEYFTGQSAQDLFVYAKKNGKEMEHLMDKAICVLEIFSETASYEKMESKEYEDFFEDEPPVNSFKWREGLKEILPLLMLSLYVGVKYWRGGTFGNGK